MAEALLITKKDIVKFTAMDGSVDSDKFIQFVKIAQDKYLENYLGTDLIDKIKADIVADTLTGNYLTLVNEYCKQPLIHWSMVEYLPFSSITIANKGVFKHSTENGEVVSKEEVDTLIERERNTAQYYTNRLIDYLSFNASSMFPEYYSNNNEDVHPDRDTFSGWVI